jgi:murein hydrolase activator
MSLMPFHSKFQASMKRGIKLLLVFGLPLFFLVFASGQSRKELEKMRSKKEKEIALTKQKLQETKKKKEKSEEVLNTLREQINQKRELVGLYSNELGKINFDIDQLNADVALLDLEINKLKTGLANLVVQGYKTRGASSKINFLFSANTFPQTIRRFVYLKKLLNFRKKQILLIQVKKREKGRRLADLKQIKAEKLGIVKSNALVQEELEQDESAAEVLVSQLQIKESTLAADLRKKEKAYRELDAALKRAIEKEIEIARKKAEEERKKELARIKERNKNKPKGSKPEVQEVFVPSGTGGFGATKSKLPWPVQGGSITQGFGSHRHPTMPDVTVINNGINIAGAKGSNVKCVYEGVVSTILKIPGMKNTILVKHDDFFTVYSKLETVSVKKGDKLKAGQNIGTLGTDTDGKTELHFEVWQGNQRMDPQKWLYAK